MWRYTVIVYIACAYVLVGVSTTGAQVEPEPIAPDWVQACAPDTVPLEGQAWWVPESGHVHIGFCAPVQHTITGSITLDVHVILHDNPGILNGVDIEVGQTGITFGLNPGATCTGTCRFDYQITANTALAPNDGWHTLRVRANVREPDGNNLLVSTHVPVYLANGKPVDDWCCTAQNGTTDNAVGKGWYGKWTSHETNFGYASPYWFDLPRAGETHTGELALRYKSQRDSSNPEPVTHTLIKLDATHDAPGLVLVDVPHKIDPPQALTLDLTPLADGWHALQIREDVGNLEDAQTMAGTTKFWFQVDHPEVGC